MMIHLIKMNEEEIKDFILLTEKDYARDRMIADYDTYETSLDKAKQQLKKILTHGEKTSYHYFFNVFDSSRNKNIGYIWLNIRDETKEAYLYQISIFKEEQRKGFGKQALKAAEQFAKENGSRVFALNVFGHNHSAQKFYDSQGYQSAAIHMNKLL